MKNKKNQSPSPEKKDKNNKDKLSSEERLKQERLKIEYEDKNPDTHGVYESESDYW